MMPDRSRSQYADRFNHDRQARGYDADVADETNPIRAGYAAALDWVAQRCNVAATTDLLELGCGTGNLTSRLRAGRITAIDISTEMMALAAQKLAPGQDVRFVQGDVLELTGALPPASFDVIASTYTLHHLTDPEKHQLLGRSAALLRPGGRLLIADLMFADATERARIRDEFARTGQIGLVADIDEEFFWDVAVTTRWLADLGLAAEWERLSALSWCFHAAP